MDVASRSAFVWLSHLAQALDTRVVHHLRSGLLVHGRSPWRAHVNAARALSERICGDGALFKQAHSLAGRADLRSLVLSTFPWRARMEFVVEKVLPADYPQLEVSIEESSERRMSVTIGPRGASPSEEWRYVAVLVAGLLGGVSGCVAREPESAGGRVRVVLQQDGAAVPPRNPSQATYDETFQELTDDVALYDEELLVGQRLFGRLVYGRLLEDRPEDAARALQAALDFPTLGPISVFVGSGGFALGVEAEPAPSVFALELPLVHGSLRVGTVTLDGSGGSDFVRACAPAVAADVWRHTRYRGWRLAKERAWTALEEALAAGVARGESNKEIGSALDRTESHVANKLGQLRAALGQVSREELADIWRSRLAPPAPRAPAPSGVARRRPTPVRIPPPPPPRSARPATPGMFAQVLTQRLQAWHDRHAEISRMRLLADADATTLDEESGLRAVRPVEEAMVDCDDSELPTDERASVSLG